MPIMDSNTLRNISLFKLLDDSELADLARQMEQKHYWAGQTIFSMGDPGGAMMIVHTGRVELFIKDKSGDRVILDYVEPGGLFGELSLLDNLPRSASARAVDETTLFTIDRHDLEVLFKRHPSAAFDMLTVLGRRIREADMLVSERVVARNANEEMPQARTFSQKLADVLAGVAGDMRFVYISFIWFAVWIVWNLGLIPGLAPFDEFPFGLLTMIVSLESIFLATFVLIAQNRQMERDKVRNDIEYEVNIKAELGIRELKEEMDDLRQMLLAHLQRIDSNLAQTIRPQTQTAPSTALPDNLDEG